MLYRVSLKTESGDHQRTESFINLLAPKQVSVHHALRHAKLIMRFEQVQKVVIHDSLPNYWPDRIEVEYLEGERLLKVLLVRVRNNNN